MKIELDTGDVDSNQIRSYSNGAFRINDTVIRSNIVISRTYIEENWLESGYKGFAAQHLDAIISMKPEIIILGTGEKMTIPDQRILAYVNQQHIGIEIMDTGAACRSYNLLIDEGRDVVACLFLSSN